MAISSISETENKPIRWIRLNSTKFVSSTIAAPMMWPTLSVLNALHVYNESMKWDVSKTYGKHRVSLDIAIILSPKSASLPQNLHHVRDTPNISRPMHRLFHLYLNSSRSRVVRRSNLVETLDDSTADAVQVAELWCFRHYASAVRNSCDGHLAWKMGLLRPNGLLRCLYVYM